MKDIPVDLRIALRCFLPHVHIESVVKRILYMRLLCFGYIQKPQVLLKQVESQG